MVMILSHSKAPLCHSGGGKALEAVASAQWWLYVTRCGIGGVVKYLALYLFWVSFPVAVVGAAAMR